MFSHEGPARSPRKNAILAGYLAFVAGFVNSGGFLLIGSFTSHVTGSIGRLSTDFASGRFGAAAFATLMVLSFLVGSIGATLILEGRDPAERSRGYGIALLVEAVLLGAFIFVAGLSRAEHPRIQDAEAALLCSAMGLQNSLVTRLSGSVVRTTHLTGVMTDLGIELARWLRWSRTRVDPPKFDTIRLLLTIVGAFMCGAILGALLTENVSRWAMAAPSAAVALASGFAFAQTKTTE